MARQTRSRGRRADLRWTKGAASFLALGAGSAQFAIVASGITSQTLMRTRGNLVAYMDGTSAPPKLVEVAVGMLVQQAGAVATSLPLSDGEAPFFYYDSFMIGYEEMVTDVIDIPGISSYRAVVDVKAMRVIRPDQEIVFIVEQATTSGAGPINLAFSARFLLAD